MPDINAYFVKGRADNFQSLIELAEQEGAIRAINRELFTLIVANLGADIPAKFEALGGSVFEDVTFQTTQSNQAAQKTAIDYRGIGKAEVLSTLQAAEAFLRHLNIGPETAKVLDEWLARDPYGKIAAAQDRVELAQVMSETGSASVLMRLNDVFLFHALVDTDGLARKLYEDLSGWGAFSGMTTMEYRRTDEEKDSHLIVEYAKRLIKMDANQVAASLKETLMGFAERNGAERYHGLIENMMELIVSTYEGNEAAVRDAFLQGDLHFRHVMKAAFSQASGLAEREDELNIPAVFDRFGIVSEAGAIDPMKMRDNPVFREMSAALEPFYKTSEVQMTGFGIITFDEPRKVGIVFTATRPAALAVAQRLPQLEVIDSRGEPLSPASPAAGARPAKRKRPGFGPRAR